MIGFKKYEFSITPEEFLRRVGWEFSKHGSGGKWLAVKICPVCNGGRSGDRNTFVVHAQDGGYSCQRAKCGASGSFWGLLESQGYNPREFLINDDQKSSSKKRKKKKFVYGK